jgi:hypothetical protein
MNQKPLSDKAKAIVKLCEYSIDDPNQFLRASLAYRFCTIMSPLQILLIHPSPLSIIQDRVPKVLQDNVATFEALSSACTKLLPFA